MPGIRIVSFLAALSAAPAIAAPIAVVAAESVYGDVARQIGGANVAVTSILANPNQDPHVFELGPAAGRAISGARIAIVNGIGYDPWMVSFLAATRRPDRITLIVADLAHRHFGDNPHIWYDPAAMLALADALRTALIAADPAHAPAYRTRAENFARSLAAVQTRIADIRARHAGAPVTATEPVLGPLFAAIALSVRNPRFQLAVMNDTEPSAADTAAFEHDLATHAVRLLVYNTQASDPTAARMRRIAAAAGIPVVGASETEPPNTSYQAWMTAVLAALDTALTR